MEFAIYAFWLCFLSYIVGVIVGEHRSDRYWREKWWELREEYMSECPETFDDDTEDEEEDEHSGE